LSLANPNPSYPESFLIKNFSSGPDEFGLDRFHCIWLILMSSFSAVDNIIDRLVLKRAKIFWYKKKFLFTVFQQRISQLLMFGSGTLPVTSFVQEEYREIF
jgi:hypothetical protein